MKTALKNNSWITTIVFALIEFPIIIFLSYFSLGSKDDVMEIYHSDPSRIIFIRGCISFVITSFLMSLIMLLYVIIKRILSVSYTHLDVYKRQDDDERHQGGRPDGEDKCHCASKRKQPWLCQPAVSVRDAASTKRYAAKPWLAVQQRGR